MHDSLADWVGGEVRSKGSQTFENTLVLHNMHGLVSLLCNLLSNNAACDGLFTRCFSHRYLLFMVLTVQSEDPGNTAVLLGNTSSEESLA